MLELHIYRRDGTLLKAYALGDSNELIVGRDEACDVRIMDRTVSREHCAIERVEGDAVVLRDLGSKGGTFVSGHRVGRVDVRDGVEVEVGPALLRFVDG